jgi:hypothetical protein
MVRCARCHFSFEPETPGLLPPCRQCGGATTAVHKVEAAPDEEFPPQPTRKFAIIKSDQ